MVPAHAQWVAHDDICSLALLQRRLLLPVANLDRGGLARAGREIVSLKPVPNVRRHDMVLIRIAYIDDNILISKIITHSYSPRDCGYLFNRRPLVITLHGTITRYPASKLGIKAAPLRIKAANYLFLRIDHGTWCRDRFAEINN